MMTPPAAPIDDGAADHLHPGFAMPDLALPSTAGGAVNLRRAPGRRVVFVYPWSGRPGVADPPSWDDIPGAHGSTPEAMEFAALYPRFSALGVGVVGISGQETSWQREFMERFALPFPILSDGEGRLRDTLRLPSFETGGMRYLCRLTLLLRDGRVERVFYPVHPPETHPSEVLDGLTTSFGA